MKMATRWLRDSALALLMVPLVLGAQEELTRTIPRDADYAALASWRVHNGLFSTDVRADALSERAATRAALQVSQREACYSAGESFAYRILVEADTSAISDVTVRVEYPPAVELVAMDRVPNIVDRASGTLEWFEDGLSPGAFLTYSWRMRDGAASGPLVSMVKLEYRDRAGQVHSEAIGQEMPVCPKPQRVLAATTAKIAAIICDKAEINCQGSLPSLGFNFRGASPNKPLGLRSREAYGDFVLGECRVAQDIILAAAPFHDAWDRDGDPSSPSLRSIHDNTNDFKEHLHTYNLEGIRRLKDQRKQLKDPFDKYWGQHLEVATQVADGKLKGNDAIGKLGSILKSWRDELKSIQESFEDQYEQAGESSLEQYPPLAESVVENSRTVIASECQVAPRDVDVTNIEDNLKRVEGTYQLILERRLKDFEQTQQQYAQLRAVQQIWQTQLNSAFQAADDGSQKALLEYISGAGSLGAKLFDQTFEFYYAHHNFDERILNELRMGEVGKIVTFLGNTELEVDGQRIQIQPLTWEEVLDEPKTRATECKKRLRVDPNVEAVEETQCEAKVYPEFVIRGAPLPAKAKFGGPTPEAPSGEALTALGANAVINPNNVLGTVCGRQPGDPYWADDCSCKCGDAVGGSTCENVKNITRHDVYVTSAEECKAEKDDHFNAVKGPAVAEDPEEPDEPSGTPTRTFNSGIGN